MPEGASRLTAIFVAATIVGICAGLVGVGGGVLLVPVLALVFGFEQHRAQGTSLIALVPPTGLFAFLVYYRAHEVDVRVGLLLIPGIFIGGLFGGKLANALDPKKMRMTFAVLLFLVGLLMIVSGHAK
jgi:uncharacterized membrane protein YfcA